MAFNIPKIMKFAGDFHIHSKYSRATSKNMDLESLDEWAKIKGVKVLGTGDFTHPAWVKNLEEKLIPSEEGLYVRRGLENDKEATRFLLTSEISCIYSKGGKVRKIHTVFFAPSLDIVKKVNRELDKIGNIKSDGRPILGLDVKELAKIFLNVSDKCFIVPAHAWTPWFSIFGSKSGFNSIEECFEDYAKYIYAIETGLSSDPEMNWRLSALDNISLISNSDCHSPKKIGREANVFDADISYQGIIDAIKSRNPKQFLYTIEFFPEEGKYHYDGHRLCNIRLTPQESKKYNGICPVCGRPLTIGVLNRVDELADKPIDGVSKNRIPFKRLIPLEEIIADALGQNTGTKAVVANYERMIKELGNEFGILLDLPKEEIKKSASQEIADGIIKVREGNVIIEPGFDGEYGHISISGKSKKKEVFKGQETLF